MSSKGSHISSDDLIPKVSQVLTSLYSKVVSFVTEENILVSIQDILRIALEVVNSCTMELKFSERENWTAFVFT